MWPIILIEECGLFEGLRQIVMGKIRILIRSLYFCLDRAPNSIRVHWDQIVWRLNYDQAGEGGSIPLLNCLYEASFVRDETSASYAAVTAVPSAQGLPSDAQSLADLPGPQAYVCGLASRSTVNFALPAAHSGYR
jgi:hypothetical protein